MDIGLSVLVCNFPQIAFRRIPVADDPLIRVLHFGQQFIFIPVAERSANDVLDLTEFSILIAKAQALSAGKPYFLKGGSCITHPCTVPVSVNDLLESSIFSVYVFLFL